MSRKTSLRISAITDADVLEVIALWQRCGLTRPWNDPASDISLARRSATSCIEVGREDGRIVSTVMVGHDGHRGWVYYLAVDPNFQGRKFGKAMMRAAEAWLREQDIEKVMLMVRPDNTEVQAFYDKLGYEVQERVIYAKWLDGREMTP